MTRAGGLGRRFPRGSRWWLRRTRVRAGSAATPVRRLRRAVTTTLARYRAKLSGPLLDRIDLRLRVPRLTKHELLGRQGGRALGRRACARAGGPRTTAAPVRGARRRRATRICRRPRASAACGARPAGAERPRRRRGQATALSGRGFDRVLKVARTIADLDGADRVDVEHVAEALSYRGGARPGGDGEACELRSACEDQSRPSGFPAGVRRGPGGSRRRLAPAVPARDHPAGAARRGLA